MLKGSYPATEVHRNPREDAGGNREVAIGKVSLDIVHSFLIEFKEIREPGLKCSCWVKCEGQLEDSSCLPD